MRAIQYPLAHHSPAKDQLLVIEIRRKSVATGNIQPLLEKLHELTASREACIQWEGKLTFYFAGWKHDPRETAEIPEIRAFFQGVTAEWPYWMHFSEKVGDTVMHVLRLLCPGEYVQRQPGRVTWAFTDPAEMGTQLLGLFERQQRLYARFALPDSMNERIAEEVAQLIENTLERN
jgi:hypothetical protein